MLSLPFFSLITLIKWRLPILKVILLMFTNLLLPPLIHERIVHLFFLVWFPKDLCTLFVSACHIRSVRRDANDWKENDQMIDQWLRLSRLRMTSCFKRSIINLLIETNFRQVWLFDRAYIMVVYYCWRDIIFLVFMINWKLILVGILRTVQHFFNCNDHMF